MAERPIRVLVVDDSAVMRQMIGDIVHETPGLELADTAADGEKALALLDTLRPDVVTLDVQMPRMDGLATLDHLLAKRPTPVLMVSALTQQGAAITLDALERGAMDYIAKPDASNGGASAFARELVRKIRSIAGSNVQRVLQIRAERKQKRATQPRIARPASGTPDQSLNLADKCIALGISTGGPPALAVLFEELHTPLPPIVIVQHMPPHFTATLAWRLNSLSSITVKEAASGDVLRPNHAYIAPGAKHLSLRQAGQEVMLRVFDGELVSGHKPSVDVMMHSAAEIYGSRCLGVIMTGMGRDGADGCRAIRAAGGYVLGQDEASSDVYGMNKVAWVEGHVDKQFGLSEAAGAVMLNVKRLWSRQPVGV